MRPDQSDDVLREIRAELMVVEPSAAFAAGVRARVEGQPERVSVPEIGARGRGRGGGLGRWLLVGAARRHAGDCGKSHCLRLWSVPGYGSMHRLLLGPSVSLSKAKRAQSVTKPRGSLCPDPISR